MSRDIDALRARIGDRLIIASVSGGKDSAAARLYLRELGIPDSQVRNVAMDTGWEWSGWRAYVEGPLAAVIGPVEIIGDTRGLANIAVHKGMFPSRLRRWCTDLLKVQPFARYIRALIDSGIECEACLLEDVRQIGTAGNPCEECWGTRRIDVDPLIVVGIRAAESEQRAKFPEWEFQDSYDAECWRPILSWSLEQVIDIHQRHGLAPNPLYLKGAKRVGCWPCIYAGKDEIKLVAEVDPGRIDEIRNLEARVTVAAEGIAAKRGEELAQDRTFFAARSPDGAWPIDRVVKWSRTMRGGKVEDRRLSLFDAMGINDGCMRWGLCEAAEDDEPTRKDSHD